MTKNFISIIFLISQLNGLDLHGIDTLSHWETLQTGAINVAWRDYHGFPISRAETTLNHPIETISNAIQDLDHYPDIFDRVTETKRLEPDVVQIILDMPFPFDGRDYVVKYTIENQNNYWVFSYSAVDHPNGRLGSQYVRLPNAAGIWILTKINESQTKIVYAWNGELLGEFPEFGLTRAWVTQGTEVLNWLDESLNEN